VSQQSKSSSLYSTKILWTFSFVSAILVLALVYHLCKEPYIRNFCEISQLTSSVISLSLVAGQGVLGNITATMDLVSMEEELKKW
jgi:hypothetical protein